MICVGDGLYSVDVVDGLRGVFGHRGAPETGRLGNGPETIADGGDTIASIGARARWEDGSCEVFCARFRDELRDSAICVSLCGAQILVERSRPAGP
ncbi:MAG: hypothetical protein AAGI50_08245 [Pseudomonadota bacterium]